MSKRVYIGVDVGKDGGIFAMSEDKEIIAKSIIPKDKNNNVLYEELLNVFMDIQKFSYARFGIAGCKFVAVIEDVHSLFGMSAKSNFSFGHIKGVKEAMMIGLNIDYTLVPPKSWQKAIWKEEDMVYVESKTKNKKKDTKATSLKASQRLFPGIDFRKSERAKKAHDGIVDAALMAEYARINEDE